MKDTYPNHIKSRKYGTSWQWDIKLRRSVFNWKVQQWDSFRHCLDSNQVCDHVPDTLYWSYESNGLFSVKSYWQHLEERHMGDSTYFTDIWRGFCPPKIETFVWQLIHGRILVKIVIHRFGVTTGLNMECPLCLLEVETVDHLFLGCNWSWRLWFKCMSLCDVCGCSSYSILQWWRGWRGMCPRRKSERAWSSLFFAVVWTIWETRNIKVFDNRDTSLNQAEDLVKFRVAWWFKNLGNGSTDTITTIVLNIKDCCVEARGSKSLKFKDWRLSPTESLKFNVDGSVSGVMGQAGIGGILRNQNGKVFCVFSTKVGVQDVITAEVMAIARAIELCMTKQEVQDKVIVF
ncbi:hypothetical protein Dsin_010243 [Dipteronia sinensis]|uniref:Reverse transcriptase zinc-binding domain-containing protein n=1 Tax=Dipteronia sinensis TaxID=43782 RepID=A0AAE0ASG0_9ROSI|nr:hypothetical protein Dsin_010243 [Dipteronia sinensis]